MATKMMRISEETHEMLARLARERHESRQVVLTRALEEYRRNHFFDALDAAYARLQAEPTAAAEMEREQSVFDGTLLDGLARE